VVQHATGAAAGLLLVGILLDVMAPRAADAMCCACAGCPGMAFCVDGLNNSFACATLCDAMNCDNTAFFSADTCEGGCGGGPVLPTATASNTPTITATATATATVTPTSAFSGQVVYYIDDRVVPGADLALTAGTTQTTVTDANGNYGFASVETGMQTLDITKQGDFNVAITALDGSFVLEFVAGLRVFDADQRLAADVTGDGTISPLDGTRILQLAAGLITRFPVGFQCFSDWAFRPMPLAVPNQTLIQPDIGGFMCTRGAIEYGSLTPPVEDQSFTAVLFGDTTGNWEPDAP
jgi:hypothetical protein